MAANSLDILCSATVLREQTPATYCRKKENKCSKAEAATTTGAPTAGEGAKETSEARNFRRWKTQR